MIIKPKLHHVTMKTSHLDDMIAWYGKVIGAKVQLRLELPGVPEPLNLSGEVRWNDPKGRAGILFREVPARVSLRLQTWLSERMAELVPGY